ncbi:MAG: hypothetical protein ACI92O_000955 [Colwellia sp.]|jgi:hypothetical protein|tara:strand:- start:3231 stop:3368 length:138 start_codon:yes stop_codon:yes gene_type:complete
MIIIRKKVINSILVQIIDLLTGNIALNKNSTYCLKNNISIKGKNA